MRQRSRTDHDSGRVFVLGRDGVAVRDASGAAVATLPVVGTEMDAEVDGVVVIDGPTATITRIDPVTLATTTWSLAPRTQLSGLRAWGGDLAWTTGVAAGGAERSVVEVDLTTGASVDLVGGLETGPHLLAGISDRLVAIEAGATGTSTVRVVDTGIEPAAVRQTVELPLERVRDATLLDYTRSVAIAAGDEVRSYSLDGLRDNGPLPGGGSVPAVTAWAQLVATLGQQGPGEVTVVDSRDLTTARTLRGLGVPSARHGMAISPDTRTLYLVATVDAGEPRLQVVDLAPEVTSIEPGALGLGGGGEVVVRGRGLEAATGNRDLQLISVTALEARFTVAPECCQGPRRSTFAIRTRDGVPSRPLVTLRFARLGPYTDGYALADGLYEDVLERPARERSDDRSTTPSSPTAKAEARTPASRGTRPCAAPAR